MNKYVDVFASVVRSISRLSYHIIFSRSSQSSRVRLHKQVEKQAQEAVAAKAAEEEAAKEAKEKAAR